jgi:hypothetical protein
MFIRDTKKGTEIFEAEAEPLTRDYCTVYVRILDKKYDISVQVASTTLLLLKKGFFYFDFFFICIPKNQQYYGSRLEHHFT